LTALLDNPPKYPRQKCKTQRDAIPPHHRRIFPVGRYVQVDSPSPRAERQDTSNALHYPLRGHGVHPIATRCHFCLPLSCTTLSNRCNAIASIPLTSTTIAAATRHPETDVLVRAPVISHALTSRVSALVYVLQSLDATGPILHPRASVTSYLFIMLRP
jgi:hypothetical protein